MKEIRERLDGVPMEPWELGAMHNIVHAKGRIVALASADASDDDSPTVCMELRTKIAGFIAAARQDIPWLLSRIEELEEGQRWIPVSERLPKNGERVLILYCGDVWTARKGRQWILSTGWESLKSTKVTGWRSLPPSPKEQETK
jgi:hypothetical protein